MRTNLGVTLFELRLFWGHIRKLCWTINCFDSKVYLMWFKQKTESMFSSSLIKLNYICIQSFLNKVFIYEWIVLCPFVKVFPNLNTQVHRSFFFFFFQTLGTDPFPLLMMCNCQIWWVIPMWGCAFCLHLPSWKTQGDNIILRPYFPWLANQWCCQKPGAALSTLPSREK